MSAIRRCIDTQIKKGYVKDADKAMKELEQLKASCDGWKNSAETAYKRVMDLSAERDGMREALNSARELLETAQRNNDCARNRPSWRVNSIFAKRIDKWLAKYPGGEK